MSNHEIRPLGEVLSTINRYPDDCWVYLPSKDKWTVESRTAVLKSEEVPPEMEDEEDAGVPAFAKENLLMRTLSVSTVQEIVQNALAQRPNADSIALLNAFLYYYDHDAFIDFSRSKGVQ